MSWDALSLSDANIQFSAPHERIGELEAIRPQSSLGAGDRDILADDAMQRVLSDLHSVLTPTSLTWLQRRATLNAAEAVRPRTYDRFLKAVAMAIDSLWIEKRDYEAAVAKSLEHLLILCDFRSPDLVECPPRTLFLTKGGRNYKALPNLSYRREEVLPGALVTFQPFVFEIVAQHKFTRAKLMKPPQNPLVVTSESSHELLRKQVAKSMLAAIQSSFKAIGLHGAINAFERRDRDSSRKVRRFFEELARPERNPSIGAWGAVAFFSKKTGRLNMELLRVEVSAAEMNEFMISGRFPDLKTIQRMAPMDLLDPVVGRSQAFAALYRVRESLKHQSPLFGPHHSIAGSDNLPALDEIFWPRGGKVLE